MNNLPATAIWPAVMKDFDPRPWAMMLLAALICTAIVIALGIAVRCTVFWIPQCAERNWGSQIAQWLSETIPVLIAIIMTRPRD